MKTKKQGDTEFKIVLIDGIEYITFPQALDFISIERATLQQRLNRERDKKEKDPAYVGELRVINIGKYNFVPLDVCKKLKAEKEIDVKVDKIKELAQMDISLEDIQKLIDAKKKEQAKVKNK